MSSREVDLSYELDGLSKGKIAIHFETVAKGKLGCVELSGGYQYDDQFHLQLAAAGASSVVCFWRALVKQQSAVRPAAAC
jgi:heat shock protein HslJ